MSEKMDRVATGSVADISAPAMQRQLQHHVLGLRMYKEAGFEVGCGGNLSGVGGGGGGGGGRGHNSCGEL